MADTPQAPEFVLRDLMEISIALSDHRGQGGHITWASGARRAGEKCLRCSAWKLEKTMVSICLPSMLAREDSTPSSSSPPTIRVDFPLVDGQ